jgi:hypothetical protein
VSPQPRRTYELICDLLNELQRLAWDAEQQRSLAEYHHAHGTSSELDTLIAGGESDPTGARALHPDELAEAYRRYLHRMERTLRRNVDRYRWVENPPEEADNNLRARA